MNNKKTTNTYITIDPNRVFGKEERTYFMGISIIWIVLFHISYWYGKSGIGMLPWWIQMFSEGQLGVDIFLFLSAYGLEASYENNSLRRFYYNRIKRLFPVYILFLISLYQIFEYNCPVGRILKESGYQITGLSLFQYADFFYSGFCIDWYTPAIILVYTTFPITSYLIRQAECKGIYAELLLVFFAIIIGNWIHCNKHVPFSLLAYRMPIILLGAIAYRHIQERHWNKIFSLYLITVCITLLCNEKAIILSSFVPLMLSFISLTSIKLPLHNIICFIGKYSYEIYLSHIFAVAFVIPMKLSMNTFYILLGTFIITTFFATIYSYIQKQFYLFIPKIIKHFRQKSQNECIPK